MRLSTFGKPRVVACAEDYPHHIGLPRGCLDDVRAALHKVGVRAVARDERQAGTNLDVRFQGELRVDQQRAAEAMLRHDTGVLAATTAFGKTVIAAWLIARRGVNALALVHRRHKLAGSGYRRFPMPVVVGELGVVSPLALSRPPLRAR